jgi:hypothetical protein
MAREAKQSKVDVRPLGLLQHPESQAVYASYVIRFVCFYLRVLGDEERRIMRFREQRDATAQAESSMASGSEEDGEADEEGSEKCTVPFTVGQSHRRCRTGGDSERWRGRHAHLGPSVGETSIHREMTHEPPQSQ